MVRVRPIQSELRRCFYARYIILLACTQDTQWASILRPAASFNGGCSGRKILTPAVCLNCIPLIELHCRIHTLSYILAHKCNPVNIIMCTCTYIDLQFIYYDLRPSLWIRGWVLKKLAFSQNAAYDILYSPFLRLFRHYFHGQGALTPRVPRCSRTINNLFSRTKNPDKKSLYKISLDLTNPNSKYVFLSGL